MEKARILIIDDDLEIWKIYQAVLSPAAHGKVANKMARLLTGIDNAQDTGLFTLEFASQGQEGLEVVRKGIDADSPFSMAFVDIRMPPGWDGTVTAQHIRRIDPDIEIVIVTAYSDRSREDIVNTVGTPEKLLFLRKPFDPEELYQIALSLTQKWRLAKQEAVQKEALRKSEERFRSLVETTNDMVWEVGPDWRFTYCSPVCEAIYGYPPEELMGCPVTLLIPPDDTEGFTQTVITLQGSACPFMNIERKGLRKDGKFIHIETSGVPIIDEQGRLCGFRGIDRDITARKLHEAELAKINRQRGQIQKFETLGTLAGGIAHDMNNLLTPIIMSAEMGLSKGGYDSAVEKYFTVISQCADRAAALIKQILTFSRKQIISPVVVNLVDIVQNFSKMLRRLIREDIELEFSFQDRVWDIKADSGQMEQIILNLVLNAKDAINDHGFIRIVVSNSTCHPHDQLFDTDSVMISGEFVSLSVTDNGTGMDDETKLRIFEPFFTTKGIGKGTGLGLSTVYGIVKQNNGHLQVTSSQGSGSCFTVYLPRHISSGDAGASQQDLVNDVKGGCETILIVEDTYSVMDVCSDVLRHYGYEVIEAQDGIKALDIINSGKKIDILLTDIIMPGIGGKQVASLFLKRFPDAKVIFMTSYAMEINRHELEQEGRSVCIFKPFTPVALGEIVRKMLDGVPLSDK